jgi:hypothetical protein
MSAAIPIAVYPAMLAGTIAGQFVGMGVDAVALGSRIIWVPLACSVLLEAVVGARYGAARVGHPLTASQRGRLSIYYSLALAAVSLPLAAWLVASRASRENVPSTVVSSHEVALWAGVALAGLLVYTAVRYALMTVLGPSSLRRPA